MDCPPERQVSNAVEPFYDLYVVDKYTIYLVRICAVKFVDSYGKKFFFFVLFYFFFLLIINFFDISISNLLILCVCLQAGGGLA